MGFADWLVCSIGLLFDWLAWLGRRSFCAQLVKTAILSALGQRATMPFFNVWCAYCGQPRDAYLLCFRMQPAAK
ncbi:hypothetical protein DFJ77DRAFT_457134 [Powellomyces hirtus]|nr:hypothetical protein DFJ77DRAFT_457134 [Powellomyces hirtus]